MDDARLERITTLAQALYNAAATVYTGDNDLETVIVELHCAFVNAATNIIASAGAPVEVAREIMHGTGELMMRLSPQIEYGEPRRPH